MNKDRGNDDLGDRGPPFTSGDGPTYPFWGGNWPADWPTVKDVKNIVREELGIWTFSDGRCEHCLWLIGKVTAGAILATVFVLPGVDTSVGHVSCRLVVPVGLHDCNALRRILSNANKRLSHGQWGLEDNGDVRLIFQLPLSKTHLKVQVRHLMIYLSDIAQAMGETLADLLYHPHEIEAVTPN